MAAHIIKVESRKRTYDKMDANSDYGIYICWCRYWVKCGIAESKKWNRKCGMTLISQLQLQLQLMG